MIEDTVAEGRRSRIVAGGPIGARPRRRARLACFGAAVTVGLALALAACGDGGGSSGVDVAAAKNPTVETTSPKSDLPEVEESKYQDETGKATVEVAAVDNAFEPRYTKVSKDTDVVFINKGAVPHNVLPATKGQFVEISAAALPPGAQATLKFTEAGTYPYYCSLHGTARLGMNGRIIVTD